MSQAFIDGQNLAYTTANSRSPWTVDLKKFRVYLREKYKVSRAYYFLGVRLEKLEGLYSMLEDSGYELIFREHAPNAVSAKKGNVDTDIVFSIMKKLYKKELTGKIILVSGDGDYWRMVEFLLKEKKFGKLLAPDRHAASSLYRQRMSDRYIDYLSAKDIKAKIKMSQARNKKAC